MPAEKVIAVSAAVAHSVTPHDLRPDVYPHPEDGLPDGLRILGLLAEYSSALTVQERTDLATAIRERNFESAIRLIEAAELDVDARAQLLQAAAALEEGVAS